MPVTIPNPTRPYPSIRALSEAFQDGSLTPSDVLRAHLRRVEKLDSTLGSFQAIYAEDALTAASAADAAIESGHRIGPFHGIPFALKDIFEVKDRITTCGSRAMLDRVSPHSGPIVRRLIAAGGILIGKTKTVECALGGWGTNQRMGTPLNPWDLSHPRVPGGSSAGSGVAVAAGLSVCATGTDTGGSVRLPAAFCGLTGLKTSKSCLPTDGIMPLSHSLDTPGPMTRSVTDTALMLAVMQGIECWRIEYDFEHQTGLFAKFLDGVAGLKFGVLDETERKKCSAEILVSYDDAINRLVALSAEIEVFTAPECYFDLAAANGLITIYEGYGYHKKFYDNPQAPMDEDVRKRMLTGRDLTPTSQTERLSAQRQCQTRFTMALTGFDALLTPTITDAAPLLSEIDQDVSPGHFTRPFNYLDMCALSMPTLPTTDGLPTSLQIVARAGQEMLTLRIGAALERTFDVRANPDFSALPD
ncbi:MAG: amidase [Paracoccaceae bacterium]|nr:amidase [Paracoccaceae bacterium]